MSDSDETTRKQSDQVESAPWVSEEAIANMSMERAIHGDESEAQTARRLFRENTPVAAAAIINIALNSPNERIRLDAAKYVVERVIGKPGDTGSGDQDKSPIEGFVDEIVTYVHSSVGSDDNGE